MESPKILESNKHIVNEINKLSHIFSPNDDNIYLENMKGIDYVYFGDEYIINYYLPLYLGKFNLSVNNNPIFLRERQIFSVNRAFHIINKYGKVLDISHMGAGKSYVIAVLSIMLGLPIVVISTKNVEPSWEELSDRDFTHLNKIKFYSLNKLTGNVKKLPTGKGIDLVKGRIEKNGKETVIRYEPGKKLQKLVSKGRLFVFDEIHCCKNNNNFTEVVHCITDYIQDKFLSGESNSKCVYASGTLSDKKDIGPIIYAMGFTNDIDISKEGKKHDKNTKKFIKMNKMIDEDNTKRIVRKIKDKYESDTKSLNKIIIRKLFISNIMKMFCTYVSMNECSVPAMMNPDFKPDISYHLVKLNVTNGFDTIIRDIAKKIIGGRGKKKPMEIYNQLTKAFNYCSIIPIIGSAIDKLMKNKNNKVVIYSNVITYNKTNSLIKFIAEHIKEKLLDNKIKIKAVTLESSDTNRSDIIYKFMNDKECRLLVSSPDVGGTAISLDDKNGNFKRYIYVNMNHRADVFLQILTRAYRESTKSKPKIIIPICIGNDLQLPKKYDNGNSYTFNNLKEYEKVMNIKDVSLEKAGKKPNGNLNYLIIKRVNEKSKNLTDFNTNSLLGNIKDFKYKFYSKANYPSPIIYQDEYNKDKLPSVYNKILKNII